MISAWSKSLVGYCRCCVPRCVVRILVVLVVVVYLKREEKRDRKEERRKQEEWKGDSGGIEKGEGRSHDNRREQRRGSRRKEVKERREQTETVKGGNGNTRRQKETKRPWELRERERERVETERGVERRSEKEERVQWTMRRRKTSKKITHHTHTDTTNWTERQIQRHWSLFYQSVQRKGRQPRVTNAHPLSSLFISITAAFVTLLLISFRCASLLNCYVLKGLLLTFATWLIADEWENKEGVHTHDTSQWLKGLLYSSVFIVHYLQIKNRMNQTYSEESGTDPQKEKRKKSWPLFSRQSQKTPPFLSFLDLVARVFEVVVVLIDSLADVPHPPDNSHTTFTSLPLENSKRVSSLLLKPKPERPHACLILIIPFLATCIFPPDSKTSSCNSSR